MRKLTALEFGLLVFAILCVGGQIYTSFFADSLVPKALRVVALDGDTELEDYDLPADRFYFFFTRAGVFYVDTSKRGGTIFKLTNWNQLGFNHQNMVRKHLTELSDLYDR